MKFFFLLLMAITVTAAAQNTGINTTTPSQALDVNGKLQVGNDAATPTPGTIRFNSLLKDFEGFNGLQWLSLTASYSNAPAEYPGVQGERLGSSVAIYGNYAVAGGPENNWLCGPGSQDGKANVYIKENNNWRFLQTLAPAPTTCGKRFGHAVAISDNIIAIGAPYDGGFASGAVYIYRRTGTTWNFSEKLLGSISANYEFFGTSVSIHGNYLAVGAKGLSDEPGKIGRAYVFENNGASFTETQRIDNPDNDTHDRFGYAVAIDSTHLIITAPAASPNGNAEQGRVFCYKLGGGTWNLASTIARTNGEAGDHFGECVSLSGTNLLIGCPGLDIGGVIFDCGAAFVVAKDINDEFNSGGMNIIPDPEEGSGNQFGCGVAVDNGIIVISAKGSSNNGRVLLWLQETSGWIFKRTLKTGAITIAPGPCVAVHGLSYVIGENGFSVQSPFTPATGKITLGDVRY
ncbi:MAG: hypothetical protein IPP73_01075 [Chitinophagaceae bacterium]|nr:hypothetical protein [Chitinophagaceae bacterium]